MDKRSYISILKDTLEKKVSVLNKLLEVTLQQEKCISEELYDNDEFEQTFTVKQTLIDQLNKLDEGFELIYEHVKEELSLNRIQYKEEVLYLQGLIRQITEKSTQIQAIEMRNKSKIEAFFSHRKKQIKGYKVNSKRASSYYKNMADQHHGESYFYDKKK